MHACPHVRQGSIIARTGQESTALLLHSPPPCLEVLGVRHRLVDLLPDLSAEDHAPSGDTTGSSHMNGG